MLTRDYNRLLRTIMQKRTNNIRLQHAHVSWTLLTHNFSCESIEVSRVPRVLFPISNIRRRLDNRSYSAILQMIGQDWTSSSSANEIGSIPSIRKHVHVTRRFLLSREAKKAFPSLASRSGRVIPPRGRVKRVLIEEKEEKGERGRSRSRERSAATALPRSHSCGATLIARGAA